MKLFPSDQYIVVYRLCALLSLLAVLPASFARDKGASPALKKEDCEVCYGVLEKFLKHISDKIKLDPKLKNILSDPKLIEAEFKKFCKTTKNRENRFCYYLGGLEESATGILGEISKPLSYSLPIEKICEKLKKKDAQICDLRYEKVIDFKTVDLKKLKVKDLKNILSSWDETCDGCIEKSDFVGRIEALKPQYVKDEL